MSQDSNSLQNGMLFAQGTRKKATLAILCVVIMFAAAYILYWYLAQRRVSKVIPRIKWSNTFGGSRGFPSSLMLGQDGTLYVASRGGKLYSVDANGVVQWAYRVATVTGLLRDAEGNIYVASLDKAYSFSAGGVKRWETSCQPGAFGGNGGALAGETLYRTCDASLCSFNKDDGREQWRLPPIAWGSAPVLLQGGVVVFAHDQHLEAVNRDGNTVWTYPPSTGDPTADRSRPEATFGDAAIGIGEDQTLYVSDGNSRFVALTKDGNFKWAFTVNLPLRFQTSPVITSDGTIIVAATAGRVYAFTPSGEPRWMVQLPRNSGESSRAVTPVLGKDGTIYVSGGSGMVALSLSGAKLWEIGLQGNPAEATLASDGTLYVSTREGIVYAVQTHSNGLMESPWPKYQHDLANSGRSVN